MKLLGSVRCQVLCYDLTYFTHHLPSSQLGDLLHYVRFPASLRTCITVLLLLLPSTGWTVRRLRSVHDSHPNFCADLVD